MLPFPLTITYGPHLTKDTPNQHVQEEIINHQIETVQSPERKRNPIIRGGMR